MTDIINNENETKSPSSSPPKWSQKDQDYWMDCFNSFSENLIMVSGEIDTNITLVNYENTSNKYLQLVRIAASMADAAVTECQLRFWIQKNLRKRNNKNNRRGKVRK